MGYCTRCGTLMSDEDIEAHVCEVDDLPERGKPIKKGLQKSEVV